MQRSWFYLLKFLLAIVLVFNINMLYAQLELPRVSPKASVSQTIGITEVEIHYCRPGVKGRTIWGGLVPYNELWRTGANEATTISFSTDAMINGNKLEKGKYSLFTIPTENEWTVVFNKNADLAGTNGYQESEDALRIKVNPMQAGFQERMMFSFHDLTDNSAQVVLHWEKLRIPFTVTVNVNDLVMAEAQKAINWQTPYRAAGYVLENGIDMSQGEKWLEISLAIEKNYWNKSLQARFLEKTGHKKDAIKVMEEALEMGKKMENQPFNFKAMQDLLAEWKK
jgi:hypothetical protein